MEWHYDKRHEAYYIKGLRQGELNRAEIIRTPVGNSVYWRLYIKLDGFLGRFSYVKGVYYVKNSPIPPLARGILRPSWSDCEQAFGKLYDAKAMAEFLIG